MNLEDMTKEEIIAYIRAEEAKKEKNALEERLKEIEYKIWVLKNPGIEKRFPRNKSTVTMIRM